LSRIAVQTNMQIYLTTTNICLADSEGGYLFYTGLVINI
jgi:hypothetical protein